MADDGKRIYDMFFAVMGLLALAPLLALVAILVKLGDGGPVFFRQERVGHHGRLFLIWKFRTMTVGSERAGPLLTAGGDRRITRVGRWLRRTKLDELPQLWNVLRGDMSFVGPRPEVPRYVALYSPLQREVLDFRPGITDPATLRFRDEEGLLAQAVDSEAFYIEHCVPQKVEINLNYARQANLWKDTIIIIRTLLPWLDRNRRGKPRSHGAA
jgi:lipopolysaccharide/colanic/teichoic acid biosynthesis glycosyltransferase